jgi:hypothetical protein
MLYRILSAVSVLALAGCQPYYTYGPGPYPQYYGYSAGRPTAPPAAIPAAAGGETNSFLANASRAGLPAGVAVTPASLAGGSFHEIDATASEVTFANQDPVRRRELADDAGRHVEWLTLKNGGVFVYERAASSETGVAASDAELLRGDLETPAFRQRGIAYDPARLERMGPFTYLTQSSPAYNCVVFRGRVRATGVMPIALETEGAGDARAYGNVCYVKQAKDLATVRSEMAAILSQARFLRPTPTAAAGTSSAAMPIPLAAKAPEALARPGGQTPIEACHALVSFSATPALKDMPAGEGAVRTVEYRVENGAYSEEASCTCRTNVSYASLSQFDAVDNARAGLEKSGFTLEKANFDETAEFGKELDYEASAPNPGGAFLVGRNFYQQCGLTVKATGTSYADLIKARKFLTSVAKAPAAPEKSAQGAPTAISPAVITGTKPAAEDAPAASPRVPVSEAAMADPAKAAPLATATAQAASAAAPQDATAARLRRLNDLLEQKLISPGEYEAKRKSILDTL